MARGSGRFKRALMVVFVGSLVFVLGGCSLFSGPQAVNTPAGSNMQTIWNLFVPIFWVSVVVFVIVQGILLYAVIRFRRRPNQSPPVPVHGNTKLEIAWTIVPALILAAIAVPTLKDIASFAQKPSNALTVHVIGHQWWWEFDYPGQKIVVADQMHVPVGTKVEVDLSSADVIHSFWIPKLAGKQDVVPNLHNHLSFTANQTGTFSGQCAEFCGEQHANMRFDVVVQSQADFDAWVKQMQQPAANVTSDKLAQEGQQLFFSGPCIGCHTIDGATVQVNGQPVVAQGTVGPNLTHVGSRGIIAGGVLTQTEQNIAKWVYDTQAVKPGNKMPNFSAPGKFSGQAMTRQQAAAIAHYLETLK